VLHTSCFIPQILLAITSHNFELTVMKFISVHCARVYHRNFPLLLYRLYPSQRSDNLLDDTLDMTLIEATRGILPGRSAPVGRSRSEFPFLGAMNQRPNFSGANCLWNFRSVSGMRLVQNLEGLLVRFLQKDHTQHSICAYDKKSFDIVQDRSSLAGFRARDEGCKFDIRNTNPSCALQSITVSNELVQPPTRKSLDPPTGRSPAPGLAWGSAAALG